MKKILLLSGFLLVATVSFAQTPTVASAVNAASYTLAGLPNAPLAQGSIFILFGTNMGPGTLQGAPSLPLQATLAGTSIRITSGSMTVQALMIYTSAGQVAAILPSNTPVGTDSLTLTFNGQTSAAFSIQVVQNNFGIFTLNQGGTGAAVILDANNVPITSLHAAAPGQVVVLWGTGLGPITSGDANAAPGGDMTSVPVDVIVGTAHATIDYRGRAPGFAGLDQINFHVPTGQLGCNVSVAVKINNIVSNLTTMAIGNGGTCSDANGFDANTLQLLNSKGSLNIGSVFLSKITSSFSVGGLTLPPTTTEVGSASFFKYSKDVLLQGSSSSGFSQPSIGSCSILTFRSGSGSGGSSGTIGITGLDAGSAITVNGPNGIKQLPKVAQVPGSYSATLSSNGQPSYIVPGSYTFSGTGGADIGAFSVTASGSPISWTNSGNISAVNRSQDLNITWAGGTAGAFVEIIGSSAIVSGNVSTSATFICIAPAAPGQFNVPSAVLLALPVTTSTSIGTLAVASDILTPVNIPGLDFAFAGFLDENSKTVNYQ